MTGRSTFRERYLVMLRPRRVLLSLTLGAVVWILAAMASRTTVFTDLDLWTFDFLCNHAIRHSGQERVVVVDLDERTFARLRQFPISRGVIAGLIRRIATASPKVIGLDLLLSEGRSPDEDTDMQHALTEAGNVILASQCGDGGLPSNLPLPTFCVPEDPSAASGFCKEGNPGALGYAFVNLPVDSDGFIRNMFLVAPGSPPSVSFPVMLAQEYAGEPIRAAGPDHAVFLGRKLPYSSTARMTLMMGGWRRSMLHVSALDVIDGKTELQQMFGEKIVLIGQSNDAARDRHFTPVFRSPPVRGVRARLAGVSIHALAVESLLDGIVVHVLNNPVLWAINFPVFVGAVWVIMRFSLRYAFFLVTLIMFAAYAAAQTIFSVNHTWFQFLTTQAGIALAVPVALLVQFVSERFLKAEALAERQQIMGLFSRYVSPEVANEIWERRQEVVLAGEERIATVLFSDIRSFTALTAGKPSKDVLHWLNEYCTAMDDVVRAHEGFLNKFIGDGLMVLYGVPLSRGADEDAVAAVESAKDMLARVADFNLRHSGDRNVPELHIGIGIHTGLLTSGNIGSTSRVEYSVIGETVNVASRLESLNKEFHTEIILSEATYQRVRKRVQGLRHLGETPVRGIEGKLHVYAVEAGQALGAAGGD